MMVEVSHPPDRFLLLVPRLDGGIMAVSGPSPGTSGRGDVRSAGVHAVAPGTWITVGIVVPANGVAEAAAIGTTNLTGDPTARIDFHAAVVRLDGAELGTRQAVHDGRRLMIFEGDDYTASVYVTGTAQTLLELATTPMSDRFDEFDQAFFRRACRLFDGLP
jgi:hypothetical protein